MRFLSSAVMLSGLILAACGGNAAAEAPLPSSASGLQLNEWTPRLATVKPVLASDDQKVAESVAIDVGVWPANKVLCDRPPRPAVDLYVAKNNEPGELIKGPKLTPVQRGQRAFPAIEFKNVSASLVAERTAKFKLVAYVRGQPVSNVWVHAAEEHSPEFKPVEPTGYGSPEPASLDTRIKVVYPHDDHGKEAPVRSATRVNIAVDLFQHGTTLSVRPDAEYTPQLRLAEGNGPLASAPPGVQKSTYTVNGQGYPRWTFNDVPVKPGKVYNFLVMVAPLGQPGGSYPSIWTHAADPRTNLTNPEPPPPCIP